MTTLTKFNVQYLEDTVAMMAACCREQMPKEIRTDVELLKILQLKIKIVQL